MMNKLSKLLLYLIFGGLVLLLMFFIFVLGSICLPFVLGLKNMFILIVVMSLAMLIGWLILGDE